MSAKETKEICKTIEHILAYACDSYGGMDLDDEEINSLKFVKWFCGKRLKPWAKIKIKRAIREERFPDCEMQTSM